MLLCIAAPTMKEIQDEEERARRSENRQQQQIQQQQQQPDHTSGAFLLRCAVVSLLFSLSAGNTACVLTGTTTGVACLPVSVDTLLSLVLL